MVPTICSWCNWEPCLCPRSFIAPRKRETPTLYLDLDGVLADFDKGAEKALGTDNIYKFDFVYGADEFWRLLNMKEDFFASLELLPGAEVLISSVHHLNPTILTATPKSHPERVAEQKRAWVRKHLGDYKVITCPTKDKPNYCKPGDILIDDRAVNKAAWEAKGGRYIIHTDVASTLGQLKSMGVLS